MAHSSEWKFKIMKYYNQSDSQTKLARVWVNKDQNLFPRNRINERITPEEKL